MGTFRRHLNVLLWKNSVLKRRHPCSLLSELFLAIASIALLALARHLTSNLEVRDFEAAHHVTQSLLVRLPDCAEFLPDCSVELVRSEPHSPTCVEGVTFGCKGEVRNTRQPGVWVLMGCSGVFRLKGHEGADEHFVRCEGKKDGSTNTCGISPCDIPEEKRQPCDLNFYDLPPTTCFERGCCFDPRRRQCYQTKFRPRNLHDGDKEPGFSGMSSISASALMDVFSAKGGVKRLDATFAVAPRGHGAEEFHSWLKASRHPWADRVRLFDSADDVEQHLRADGYPQRNGTTSEALCGAVIFETEPWSHQVKYTLRFNQSLGYDPNLPTISAVIRSTKLTTDGLVEPKKDGQPKIFDKSGLSWYSQSGFLAMQRTVDSFIERISHRGEATGGAVSSQWFGEDGRPHVVVPFPTLGWSLDVFAMLMPQLLSAFLLISLAYSVNRMITGVVMEREARLREGMRMMGMRSSAFYASWVATYVLLYLFVVTGVVLLLSVGEILPRSSPSLLFVWLMIFSLASIAYGLVITTFFTRAKTAATVGSIIFYTTSYFKYLANAATPSSTLRLLSLLPPVAFELGADLVAGLESQQVGLNWSNVNIRYHNYSLLESGTMLLLDTLLLSILFLYLDQVMPREVGIQRPWYFPISPYFWADLLGKAPPEAPIEAPTSPEVTALVERDVGEAAAMMSRNGQTVEISKLSKQFGQMRAVDNLDLVMYQGEIFALLGHNGAGKTTTLGMLCGLIPATSGRCLVFGSDRQEEVQQYLGVCPQHDVLWETLTCEEHLKLFAGFKGVPAEAVDREVTYMLDRVGLEKAGACKVQAGRLSGGMKRKLSLGIAFLGGSRLVVLDEPTSGLDPFSRRAVWELLRSMKQGRVTVLSTHYMDEADILGDRIAILHEGRLKCCGSPQFLKRAYDCGYNVTFVKRPGCDIDVVREAVCRHVPELTSDVSVLSNSGKELILQFPFSAARHFPKVLGSLEQQLEELRLESYGISVTTLEEVFLKVASGDAVPRSKRAPVSPASPPRPDIEYIELGEMGGEAMTTSPRPVSDNGRGVDAREVFAAPKNSKGASCLRQTQALVKKRIKYGLRDRRGVLCQLLMPTATLVLFLVLLSKKLFSSQPVLELSMADFNKHCHYGRANSAGVDFSNRVEFSHLPAVDMAKAREVLQPGEELWQAELRHHAPPPASEEELHIEQAAFITTPGILQRVLQLDGLGKDKGGRRLSQANASNIMRTMSKFFVDRYASFRRAQDALEAVAHSFPAQGDRLISSWMDFAELATDEGSQRRLFAYGHLGFDRLCPTATKPERMLWHYLDRDHDNVVSREDLKLVFRDIQKRHNSSVAKLFAEGLVQEEIRRQLGFDIDLGMVNEHEMEEWLDWIVEEAAISLLDVDGDGTITIEDFCTLGTELKGQAEHFVDLAQSFSEAILDSSCGCPRYGAFYVVAAPRTKDSFDPPADAVVFANTSSKHSAAVYQAALTNARLARLKKGKTVAVKVHLFPQTKDEQITLERFAVFMLAVYITFCLSYIPAGITHYLVKERTSGARQLQALSGASHFSYWLSNMIYDMALYVLPAVSVPVALEVFGYHTLLKGDCGQALFAVLAAFGPAIAGFSYVVSFLFKDHSRASNTILSFCLVGAIVLSTVLFVLTIINYDPSAQYPAACDYPTEDHPEGNCRSPGARIAERILSPLFRMVPTVCIYQALFAIAIVANLKAVVPEGAMDALNAVGGEGVPHVNLHPFSFEWAGEPLLYLVVEGFAFFFVAILLDYAIHSPGVARYLDAATFRHHVTRLVRRREQDETRLSPLIESSSILEGDDSVWAERERAAMATKQELALHVWDLEKTYRRWLSCRSPKRAVRGVSFAIHSGEVFGLLGHNGAGKTSAIKCFVGEQCCSTGAVHVGGYDMETQTGKARQRLGYCPQFDALLELLTVEDHLEFYAAIRGLPKQAVEDSLQDFKLIKMARRRAEVLSGGNKRKLSAALALMGSPSLAILDEPSCGLDPAARRALWTAVHEAVGISSPMAGCSSPAASAVLLTTHSMEEAEALSNRLGIMANGQLLTVGTAQQIKAKHGSCHELMLRLRPETEEALNNLMREWQPHLDAQSVGRILESDAWKRAAYTRPRCIVRLQLEQSGVVESSVFAEWFLQQASGEKMEQFLSRLLGDRVELAEDFGIYWRFRLPRSGLGLPQLFQQLEDNAENFGVAEYTLSQATLEQIFNSITEGADTYGSQSG